MRGRQRARDLAVLLLVGALASLGPAGPSSAQGRVTLPQDDPVTERRAAVRFLTESDHPPFNYLDEDGTLRGLNVDLAKALCLELAATCDIQVRPWPDLLPALRRNATDAIVASMVASPGLLADAAVSDRYFVTPARFVAPKDVVFADISPSSLARKRIAVAKGTAHEAYLRTFFRLSDIQAFDNVELARDAVRTRAVDLLFDDGASLVFWLNGEASKLCCEFKGGAFFEPNYFGDGLGVVLRKQDTDLRIQINAALRRLRDTGRLNELKLRYFPIQPY